MLFQLNRFREGRHSSVEIVLQHCSEVLPLFPPVVEVFNPSPVFHDERIRHFGLNRKIVHAGERMTKHGKR